MFRSISKWFGTDISLPWNLLLAERVYLQIAILLWLLDFSIIEFAFTMLEAVKSHGIGFIVTLAPSLLAYQCFIQQHKFLGF